MTEPCYIFDLDGVLRDPSHREHFLKQEPKDWEGFFAAQIADKPIMTILRLAETLSYDVKIIVCTGGGAEHASLIEQWLFDHCSWFMRKGRNQLYTRAAGDRRDDSIVKVELVRQIITDGYEPLLIFEDRRRVVDALRAQGWLVAQVAPGDF